MGPCPEAWTVTGTHWTAPESNFRERLEAWRKVRGSADSITRTAAIEELLETALDLADDQQGVTRTKAEELRTDIEDLRDELRLAMDGVARTLRRLDVIGNPDSRDAGAVRALDGSRFGDPPAA
jgi:hypothetical protein